MDNDLKKLEDIIERKYPSILRWNKDLVMIDDMIEKITLMQLPGNFPNQYKNILNSFDQLTSKVEKTIGYYLTQILNEQDDDESTTP